MCLWSVTFTNVSPVELVSPFAPYSYPWLSGFQSISMKAWSLLIMLLLLFFNSLGETGRPQEPRLSLRPVLWWSLFLWRVVGLCYWEGSWLISQWWPCPFPCQNHEGTFLMSSWWESRGFPGGRAHGSVGSLSGYGRHEFLTILLPTIICQQFLSSPFTCSSEFGVPVLQLGKEILVAVALWMCLSLQIWGFALKPWNLSSLIDTREVNDF